MFFKNSIFIALFGFSCLLNANTLTYPSSSLLVRQNNGGPCDAPAPTNFQVVNIGTTWVDLTWLTSNPTDFHRIKTYETNSGILVSNILVPPGLLVQKVIGLQPGFDYYSRINVVCKNGYDSENYAEVHFIAVIAELIVIGRESTNNNGTCTIYSNGGSCSLPANGTPMAFKIRSTINPNIWRKFSVSYDPIATKVSTKIKTGNLGMNYAIQCNNQDPDVYNGISYQIKLSNQEIAAFEVSYQSNPPLALLNCTLAPGYAIDRLDLNFSGENPNGLSSGPINTYNNMGEDRVEPLNIMASPNPFSESLTVYLDAVTTGQVSFKLFNLNGQKVFEQQYMAGSEQFELNTSDLPKGFYLLRVEAGDEVQTLKVVKSE